MYRGIAIPSIVCCLLCSTVAGAQTPAPELARLSPALDEKPAAVGPAVLVKDIATQQNLDPRFTPGWRRFVQLGSELYFAASDGVHGWELWRRRQGVFQKAEMVVDICPGECSAAPWQLTVAHGWLYFTAEDGSHGRELWRSDGTAEGTELVRDIHPGLGRSDPAFLTVLGDRLYFSADDGSSGDELWSTDGTGPGTFQVADIRPGPEGSAPASLAVLSGMLYFTAEDGQIGRELWRSDGTAAGTLPVDDLCPGADSCFWRGQWVPGGPRVLRPFGDQLILAVGVPGSEFRLWKSDGSAAGTMPLGDVGLGWLWFVELGGVLYFQGEDEPAGSELWRTDGTDAGTYRVRDIAPGIASSGAVPMAAVGADLYLRASDGQSGLELWKSDGTEAGTVAVRDIRPGAAGSLDYTFFGSTAFAGRLIFKADDGTHGLELWVSDGTEAGTALLRDIYPGPLGAFDDRWAAVIPYATEQEVLFSAWEPEFGFELWRTDGTRQGTTLAQDLDHQYSSVPFSYWFRHAELGNGDPLLFFSADDAIHGTEPWVSDGTSDGTRLLKDIDPGSSSGIPKASYPREFTLSCHRVFFFASGGDYVQLWVSDGTEQGTYAAVDASGYRLITRQPAGPLCEEEIFFVDDHLWRSDGTPSGTYPLSSSGRLAGQPTAVGRTVYFSYEVTHLGRELWKSDGTPAGTVLVEDVLPGGGSSSPYLLAGIDDELFFVADDGLTGRELWKSDGSPAGTVQVADIRPGPEGSLALYLHAGSYVTARGVLFFVADDGLRGEELWKSDGTPAGTAQVADIFPGPGSSEPRDLVAVGNRVFFSADDGLHGRELWVADGTLVGARLVRDINPGAVSALSWPAPSSVSGSAGGRLFFAATDGRRGLELWTSDGTRKGTFRLQDLHPGSGASSPAHFTRSGTSLFFTASDGRTGFELWRLPIPQLDD